MIWSHTIGWPVNSFKIATRIREDIQDGKREGDEGLDESEPWAAWRRIRSLLHMKTNTNP